MQKEIDFYIKGNELSKLGKYKEAITYYSKSLELRYNKKITTQFKKIIVSLGKIFIKEDYFYKKGGYLFDLGRFKKALTCYNKVLEINPQNKGVLRDKKTSLYNIAGLLASSEKYNEAIAYYDKALEITIDADLNKDIFFKKGACFIFLKKYKDALSHYNKALASRYGDRGMYYNKEKYHLFCKGIEKARGGLYEKALTYFDDASGLELDQLYPAFLEHVEILYNKGFCLVSSGKYKKAESCFKKGISIIKRKELEFIENGLDYINYDDRLTAKNYFNIVLEINAINRDALFNIGEIFLYSRDYVEAIIRFDKILEINLNDIDALHKKCICLELIYNYYTDVYLVRYGNYYNFFHSYEDCVSTPERYLFV